MWRVPGTALCAGLGPADSLPKGGLSRQSVDAVFQDSLPKGGLSRQSVDAVFQDSLEHVQSRSWHATRNPSRDKLVCLCPAGS